MDFPNRKSKLESLKLPSFRKKQGNYVRSSEARTWYLRLVKKFYLNFAKRFGNILLKLNLK